MCTNTFCSKRPSCAAARRREDESRAAFADLWCAILKVVFSHTLDSVQGNARLAEASLRYGRARES
jgi:hypothetical protein